MSGVRDGGGGPSQSSAAPYTSARRRSHVPDGGTRTRSSHRLTPLLSSAPPVTSSSSFRVRGLCVRKPTRTREASCAIAVPVADRRVARSQKLRRASRIASANGQ